MSLAGNTESRQTCGKYSGKERSPAPKAVCTGCGACLAVCPLRAVSMEEDKVSGFFYPHIDIELCVRCGRCESICPANHTYEDGQEYPEVYAANSRSMEIRYRSASGGLFSVLAIGMLRRGGCVAGVVFAEGNTCKHTIAETEGELMAQQGTKYFQSDMTGIYKKLEYQIKEKDKEVLFCGTPCQVRAIKNYAQEKGIEDRLVLLDLLCKSIPSPYSYKKYIEFLEKKSGKRVKTVQFKEKTLGWDRIGTSVTYEDGSTAYINREDSPFARSFIDTNFSVRESCFQCRYKTTHREGDITIGDFWGLQQNHLLDNKGTSLVIVNTDRGKALFRQIKQDIDYVPSTMWRAYRGNWHAFHKISNNSLQQERFFRLMRMGRDIGEAMEGALHNEK